MKKLIYFSFLLCAFVACKKEAVNANKTGSGSIILEESPTANSGASFIVPPFTSQDSTTVYQLMQVSNLSTNGFAFFFYESYNALNQNSQMALYQIAQARQVRNGLPVFFEDITFGFENGKLNGPPPASQFIVGNIALDNKPTQSLQNLRTEFIKIDNAQEAHSLSIQDSTLVAQLGYYNLNVNQVPTGGTPDYIKVWYVHPAHSTWPHGYFRDDTGAELFFTPFTHSGPQTP
jgi:hypothetical protein